VLQGSVQWVGNLLYLVIYVAQSLPDLPRALGMPDATGITRSIPGDFTVTEIMDVEPVGKGEHVWLLITKTGLNSQSVVTELAKLCSTATRDTGYAGLKDRNAVTTQWFSVAVSTSHEPDWQALDSEQISVKKVVRHTRKLRRGTHRGNHFSLRFRDVSGDHAEIGNRIEQISARGTPNYFGEQRFGRNGNNLVAAEKMFRNQARIRDRHRRGLYLSAARSLLFNLVLARRVTDNNWDRYLGGEVMMLNGKKSFFRVEAWDEELDARLKELDIHPTGPLWGKGQVVESVAHRLEEEVLADESLFREGLEGYSMKHERRPLRMCPRSIDWSWDSNTLELSFELGRGEFATSLIREIIECH
jgi:tRNA pseudouridine13 synthase